MALKITLFLIFSLVTSAAYCVEVQLAKSYQQQPINDYLVSEKLDGVRAIWKNNQLVTRNGNVIHAPTWFTEDWPSEWLDGELWSSHGDFEFIASTVLDTKANHQAWRKIRFYVFDMPNHSQAFHQRYLNYKILIEATPSDYLAAIEQRQFTTYQELDAYYQARINQGAEGIMLHAKDAQFSDGRSDNLLKLKPYQDAEAKVVGYSPGKGKYHGLVGALIVELPSGQQIKLGSGLSDVMRNTPPEIGSMVTYRYNGLTKYGKPRFARFLRVRHSE